MNMLDIKAMIEEANAKVQAELMANKTFVDFAVNQGIKGLATTKLRQMIDGCKLIIDSNKLPKADGSDRRWNGGKLFNLGVDLELLNELITGIQYSHPEHKKLMLQLCNADDVLVDSLANALGSRQYWSNKTNTIHTEVKMDVGMVEQLARLFGFNNGITIDLNIDEIKVDHEWAKAKLEAEIAELRYKEALQMAQQGGGFVMTS
jgi:hypothetical protein